MRDGIELIGKKVTIDNIQYKINNFILIPGNNKFYVELESKNGYLNISLKALIPLIINL